LFTVFVVLLGTIYVPGIRFFLSFSNLDSFQNSTIEHHCTHACSHIARFPVLTSYCREDEPVSPTQTILLKLLDSFLNPVPTPFRGRHDHLNNLTGFLASVFLFQAKHAQHVIQYATGEPPPGENILTDVGVAASCALDGRLPGVWVALVLLSTSLSSILLAEQEDHSGANTDPGVVTLTHLCHDTISVSRSRTGSGFIEELVGMMVPHSTSRRDNHSSQPRNPASTPPLSPTYQFWEEGQVIPERSGSCSACSWRKNGGCFRLCLP
jgi:hypothetical protein